MATVVVLPPGALKGVVIVSGMSVDAISGVASSVLHVGAVGGCPSGPVIAGSWDTTGVASGSYEVCNVVTDNAGHTATATLSVTVANAQPLSPAQPVQAGAAAAVPVGATAPGADKLAPRAPTKLEVLLPRSHRAVGLIPVTVRWVNPAAADFDRVVAVLNLARPPHGPRDGAVVYTGARASATLELRLGQKGRLALFAYDHAGNVSPPARRTISLAPLSALRPVTGTVVATAPRLSWKPKKGTAYYNVQLFHNGKRVLVDWPSRASYRIPSARLEPGTYVWFVWPAVRHKGAAPTFGALIGRATFVYRA
jgi:hypothetical protein